MKITLSLQQRILIALAAFVLALVGFMVKLPSGFRGMDKELHAAFYFCAAAFLNLLFARKSLVRHALIFGALYIFGVGIEYAQAYSNQFYRKRIHGRFDPEDVQSNLKGLIAFSVIWLLYLLATRLFSKSKPPSSS